LGIKIKGVNRVGINVEDIGSGKPVVFIQGRPVNHNMFEYQFTELPKIATMCGPDVICPAILFLLHSII
jgi:non-heme chloroperoxidase